MLSKICIRDNACGRGEKTAYFEILSPAEGIVTDSFKNSYFLKV